MQHRPFVFIDVETTGMASREARIIEVGALRVENNTVVQKFSQLLDPGTSLPSIITNITGIRDQDLQGKPVFADIAGQLQEMFRDAIFVAHNVSFDYGFMTAEFKRLGKPFQQSRLCTVRLSRALYPNQKSHRLDELIRIHGYDVVNRHRAYDDAEVLYKFYRDHLEVKGLDLYRIMNRLVVGHV